MAFPGELQLYVYCFSLTKNYIYIYKVELRWLEHRWLVYHGLFGLIFESLRNSSDSSRTHILRELFLFYYEMVCCVYSLESPRWGDSNEYTQHTIILLKIENISISYRHLLSDLLPWLKLIGSNYPSLEQISTVPKMFEPLKFDCIYDSASRKGVDFLVYESLLKVRLLSKSKMFLEICWYEVYQTGATQTYYALFLLHRPLPASLWNHLTSKWFVITSAYKV